MKLFQKLSLLFFVAVGLIFTLNSTPTKADTFTWNQINSDGFGINSSESLESLAVFNNKLYAGITNSSGAQVWEYSGSGTTWTLINTNGFGSTENSSVAALAVFNNKLYAGTYNRTNGPQVWEYSGSGTTWTQVNTNGFGSTNDGSVYKLVVFNNKLYAGIWNNDVGAQVWEYSGSGTTWTLINTNGFGSTENSSVTALAVFNNKLYAGTLNNDVGAQVWEYSGSGTTWTQVNTNGFENEYNRRVPSLVDFNNKLYANTSGFLIGVQIWEYSGSGTTWTQVNTNGFGDNLLVYSSDTVVFSGKLCVGTSSYQNGKGRVFAGQADFTAPTTTATPKGGTYKSSQIVTLSATDNEGGLGVDKIYYTTDGSTPTTSSSIYTSPISIFQDTTLKFFATDLVGNQEQVKTENYIIKESKIITTKKKTKFVTKSPRGNEIRIKKGRTYEVYGFRFSFKLFPKKLKKKKYYLEIQRPQKYPPKYTKAKKSALKKYWLIKTNFNQYKPKIKKDKFAVKLKFFYSNKELKALKKKNKGLKEKNLALKYRSSKSQGWGNLSAKLSLKGNVFTITFNKFSFPATYFAIGLK